MSGCRRYGSLPRCGGRRRASCLLPLSFATRHFGGEGLQRSGPDATEPVEPLVDVVESVGAQSVDPPGAVDAHGDEPGLPQDPQVVGNRRMGDPELLLDGRCQFPGGGLAPIPLILLTRVPSRGQALAAARLAAEILKVVRRTRRGTRFGIHLCYGDMNHRSMAEPEDTRPAVLLANALVKQWPQAQELEFIHMPFGRGIEPPPLDGGFYAALAELRLPPEVRFAAGIVHEGRELDELRRLRNRIETLVGRPVDVAAACGLGRRDRERAVRNLALSQALAE